jgi:hypothetical protein
MGKTTFPPILFSKATECKIKLLERKKDKKKISAAFFDKF